MLSKIWDKTDKAHTGVNISKIYETKLILNPENFELAESLGLEVLPEHDGLGVFADAADPDVAAKVDEVGSSAAELLELLWDQASDHREASRPRVKTRLDWAECLAGTFPHSG